jgi:hypothetical protein
MDYFPYFSVHPMHIGLFSSAAMSRGKKEAARRRPQGGNPGGDRKGGWARWLVAFKGDVNNYEDSVHLFNVFASPYAGV